MTSAMRCLHGGKAAEKQRRGQRRGGGDLVSALRKLL